MQDRLLMSKDRIVAAIDAKYNIKVFRRDLLPHMIRAASVNYDDIIHGWENTRALNLGRTNAKAILNTLRLPQNNNYAIAAAFHFASLKDTFWMQDEQENLKWKDVSLFSNTFDKIVLNAALTGEQKLILGNTQKLYTPETSTDGMSAKCWNKDEDGQIWLYKVGKKELYASALLDHLGVDHVEYSFVPQDELLTIITPERFEAIVSKNEIVTKCECITSEDVGIITWYDFMEFCHKNNADPYEELFADKNNEKAYHKMQVSDYILANEDRHGANWGFFVDQNTGEILGLHPLFDHDHAFSTQKDIPSQTAQYPSSLKEAALQSIEYLKEDEEFIRNVMELEISDTFPYKSLIDEHISEIKAEYQREQPDIFDLEL